VIPTVLLVTGFILINAEGTLFAIRHDYDLFGAHPNFLKIIASGLGAFIAQHHIIVTGPSFIAMPLNLQHRS
jgi:hypothetical protein